MEQKKSLDITHSVTVNVDRNRNLSHDLELKGKVYVEHYDKDGNLKEKFEATNSIKNAGKDKLLDVCFHGVTQIATWYCGLINDAGWTAEAAGDTLASHTGWVEFTNYTGNRQEWTEDAASGGIITNTTLMTFPITVAGSLKGIFIASIASGTSGVLWSTVDFPASRNVQSGDNFKVTYLVSL